LSRKRLIFYENEEAEFHFKGKYIMEEYIITQAFIRQKIQDSKRSIVDEFYRCLFFRIIV